MGLECVPLPNFRAYGLPCCPFGCCECAVQGFRQALVIKAPELLAHLLITEDLRIEFDLYHLRSPC